MKARNGLKQTIILTLLTLVLGACLSKTQQNLQSVGACGSSNAYFDHPPILTQETSSIQPIGTLNPPHHTIPTAHMYWNFTAGQGNVYSPGNATLTRIQSTTWLVSPFRQGHTDYALSIKPCDDVLMTLGHVSTVSSRLQAEIASLGSCSQRTTTNETVEECYADVYLDISSGEVLGTAGAIGGGIDFGLVDMRLRNTVINTTHAENYLYVACPLDYFTASARSSINPYLDTTISGDCGEVAYDALGSASGLWFDANQAVTGYVEPFAVVFARNHNNPLELGISIGDVNSGSDSRVHYFSPQTSGLINRAFEDVINDGNIYCYSNGGFESLILQLNNDGTLSMEYISGSDCSATPYAFTSNAILLER